MLGLSMTKSQPKSVSHSDLKRFGDGDYKSECPDCDKGILLVRRNDDFTLSRLDTCLSCGKSFLYTDDNING